MTRMNGRYDIYMIRLYDVRVYTAYMYIQFNGSSKLLHSKLPTLCSIVLGSNQIPASLEIRMDQRILNNCAEVHSRHIRHFKNYLHGGEATI